MGNVVFVGRLKENPTKIWAVVVQVHGEMAEFISWFELLGKVT